MGLEMVGIVLQTEETFGIIIPDEDVFEMATVGQYYDYIVKRVEEREKLDPSSCLSSAVFYRLRRSLIDNLGVKRNDVTPDADLELMIPREQRKTVWQQIVGSLNLGLPPLRRPFPLQELLLAVFICAFFGCWSFSSRPFLPGGLLYERAFASLLIAALLFFTAWSLTEPLAVHIPFDCRTPKKLVRSLVRKNSHWLEAQRKEWNREEIWEKLVVIAVRSLGVSPESVTKDARWVDDLGAG